MPFKIALAPPNKRYSVALLGASTGITIEIRSPANRRLKSLALGKSVAPLRDRLYAYLQGRSTIEPLFPSPTRHTGRHTRIVPCEKGLFLLPVTERGKCLRSKSIYLPKAIVEQLVAELAQLYTPTELIVPLPELQQAFFQVLAQAQDDKDLEGKTRQALRDLGYTVPPTYDQQRGQVWNIIPYPGKRSIYFDALSFSDRQVVFVENKFHQSHVATEEVFNFARRLQQVRGWVGDRQVIAAFVSLSPITKRGYAILKDGKNKFYDELLICIKNWNGKDRPFRQS
ncbi:MAG: hypothetical protein ACE5OZ_01175 [Candidatus Heimdallarchaeota archaeon]